MDLINRKIQYPTVENEINPITRTMYPSTSGTSVIGFIYNGGVMIAADTKGSYGSLSRFMNIERVFKVTEKVVVACSGDIADYQFIRDVIEQKVRDDQVGNYSNILDAGAIHSWLSRVLYNRRSKFDPLWIDCAVAGFRDGKPYLGFVNKIGMSYEADEISSGFGVHFAIPMIRDERERKQNLSKADAKKLMHECMKMLYYRDCKAHFKYQLADITTQGINFETIDLKKETDWSIAYITQGNAF